MFRTRPGKIIHLLVFLIALAGLVYGLSGTFHIPSGDKAIWLHGGLLLIAIGSYWIEYRFTKPDDVVINGLIVFVSISVLNSPPHQEWWEILRYLSLTLVVASFLISWHGSPAIPHSHPSQPKRLLYLIVVRLGNANVIFSAVFLLAMISYFDLKSADTKWMLTFWAVLVSARYLELEGIFRWIASFRHAVPTKFIGELSGIIEPNIVRFRLLAEAQCRKGSMIVLTKGSQVEHDSPVGVVTGFRYAPETVEAEALIIESSRKQGALDQRTLVSPLDMSDPAISEKLKENVVANGVEKLLAISRKGSEIARLYFELIVTPAPLEEGHLVSVAISETNNVFYQVINGMLYEEDTLESNERSFTVGEAEQLGTWHSERQGFETYSWVVRENSPVMHVLPDDGVELRPEEKTVDIGRIPNSNFPVNINIDDLVLFHSALLGVTGSGKTFLAYHLIETAAANGMKVLCLDATGDYKRYLQNVVLLANPKAVKSFLDEADLKIGIVEFVEENVHPIKSTRGISQIALSWCKDHRTEEEIKEPVPKVLVVLEEAHTLIPEWNFNPERKLQDEVSKTAQIVLQARKYGLGFMVITQRTANVTKSILNQCNSICAFQAYDETGFDFMKNYMGEHYVKALPNLKRQHGVLVGKASLSDRPVIARYHDQEREVASEAPPEYPAPDQVPVEAETSPS